MSIFLRTDELQLGGFAVQLLKKINIEWLDERRPNGYKLHWEKVSMPYIP